MIKQGATREGWWNAFIPHPAHFYSCPVLEQVGVGLAEDSTLSKTLLNP